jgi:hypothetical protein
MFPNSLRILLLSFFSSFANAIACPTGRDYFSNSSLFTSAILLTSSGRNTTVYRNVETGNYYLPFVNKAPAREITYNRQNINIHVQSNTVLPNSAYCSNSTTGEIGWAMFYSAAKIVFPPLTRAWLDLRDNYTAEKCLGNSTGTCDFIPSDSYNGHRMAFACGPSVTAAGRIDLTGTGFTFHPGAGSGPNPYFFYSGFSGIGSYFANGLNTYFNSVLGCSTAGVSSSGIVNLTETVVLMPQLPQYPGAINPTYVWGASSYIWTCAEWHKGPSMSLVKLENDTWRFTGGPVNCTSCFPGSVLPTLNSYASSWSCVACQAGTHSPSGMTCLGCPPGTYSLSGASKCTPCPTGTFSRVTNATSNQVCLPCQSGSFADTEGSTSCILCPSDWSSDAGASVCTAPVLPSATVCSMRFFPSSEVVGTVLQEVDAKEEELCLRHCCGNQSCVGYTFYRRSASFRRCSMLTGNLTYVVPGNSFSSGVRPSALTI